MPCQHQALHRGADPTAGCSQSQACPAVEPGPWPGCAQRRCPIIASPHRGSRSPAGTNPSLPASVLQGLRVAQLILAVRNCFGILPGWDKTHTQLGVPWPGKRHPLTPLFSQTGLRTLISEGAQSYRTHSSGPTVLLVPSSPLHKQGSHIPGRYLGCSPKAAC